MMAERGGIAGVSGEAAQFEYWSLAKKAGGFGYRASPVKTDGNRAEMLPEDFLDVTAGYLDDAIARWIKGAAPFTARLNPNLEVYSDYDQLMRLEEWLGREGDGAEGTGT
jgi:ATP-dependent helicase/nuclease subunit B